jgi:dTMP kinase
MDHVESEIDPFVSAGGIIVSDRYDASSLAYQSVMSGRVGPEAIEWIRTLNRHAQRPDLTLVLSVPPEIAAERRIRRGDAAQLYDQNETQRALAGFYAELPRHLPEDRIVILDGAGTSAEVAARVYAAYVAHLGEPQRRG